MSSLVDDNLDIVFKQAALLGGVDRGDYITSGYIGLLDAASKFRPDGGASFRTVAYIRVRGAIRDQKRFEAGRSKRRKPPKRVPLTDFVSAAPIQDDGTDEIRWMTAGLVPEHRMTALMLAEGLTQDEIGVAIGVSNSRVSQNIRRVIRPAIKRRLKERVQH